MSFVMSLDPIVFMDVTRKAQEKDVEDRIWQKWLAELPNMNQETFISFDEYMKKHKATVYKTTKTDEEIFQDAENILKMMSRPK